MNPVTFGTKSETLERLASRVTSAHVLPQVRFTVGSWLDSPDAVVSALTDTGWMTRPVIVRSSAIAEDGSLASMAGRFLTVPDVAGAAAVRTAIARVVESYGRKQASDQVFVQPMLERVRVAGVAFSRDPNTGGPYRVINYDDQGGSTASVTAGRTELLRTFYCSRFFEGDLPQDIRRVVALLEELEGLLGTDALDVEFAVSGTDDLYLLQARRLTVPAVPCDQGKHLQALHDIERRIRELNHVHPQLHGSKTVFGVMPDWNPAEIIGIRPRPLALSLYKDLVTDNIWAYQRDNYGYKNLRSFPLLTSFAGLPYIDARVDFNSFIPAGVAPDLAERLADYYLDRLIDSPSHHDKVEFEIIFTCYTFDLHTRLQALRARGFQAADLEALAEHLRGLTNRIINRDGLWKRDVQKIGTLDGRRTRIMQSGLDATSKIYWLLEDCKRYGTLPFAGLARAAFIAVQTLKSLVAVGVFDRADLDNYMGSLETVSSGMARDLPALGREAFLQRYGHLRPGTYDILSPRYDEAPERYFDWSRESSAASAPHSEFRLRAEQAHQIDRLLKQHRIDHDVQEFFDFLKGAIEGREFAKFVFTHSVSDALVLFKGLGEAHGLSLEDCSFADVASIRELYASSDNVGTTLHRSVALGKERYDLTLRVCLPALITSSSDVWAFEVPPTEPNFITLEKAVGPVAFAEIERSCLEHSIVFIPSADPGYDWIFTHRIAGFVTKYGGVNSHMAIRSAEMRIPAVIGAGESLYAKWSAGRLIELDCSNRQVRVL